jgi:hypothetical protein
MSRQTTRVAGGVTFLSVAALTLAGDRAASRQMPSMDPTAACRVAGSSRPLPDLPEASGIARGRRPPHLLWMHDDSAAPEVLGFDPDGQQRARVRVTGAAVEDWEDLAIGPCPSGTCLYIADIGDNDAERARITVYRIPEPSATDRATAPAEVFHAVYPNGPRDAESVLVTAEGRIIVATKGRETALYQFPPVLTSGGVAVLERLLLLDEDESRSKRGRPASRVTGGSVSSDGKWMAVRSYTALRFFRSSDLLAGRTDRSVSVDLTALDEPQGEGVAFGEAGAVYLVSEGGGRGRPGRLTPLTCQLPG